MCMIEDLATGRILVQHRLPKASNPWCGLTFPGGHVEAGESITASTVREIREETGLTVSNLRMCGVVEWETIGERANGSPAEVEANSKYIVFMFRTSTFTGELKSSTEGVHGVDDAGRDAQRRSRPAHGGVHPRPAGR